MKAIRSIYDNGGETADRYTIFFNGDFAGCLCLSAYPDVPNGVSYHSPGSEEFKVIGLGNKIQYSELPKNVRRYLRNYTFEHELRYINLHGINLEWIIDKYFPSGSGFNYDYEVVEYCNSFHIKSSYQCMDEHGGYDGYQDFTIILQKKWIGMDFKLQFTGDRYKAEKHQLREYMEDTLHHCFQELFNKIKGKKRMLNIKDSIKGYYRRELDRVFTAKKGSTIKFQFVNDDKRTKWMTLNPESLKSLTELLKEVEV